MTLYAASLDEINLFSFDHVSFHPFSLFLLLVLLPGPVYRVSLLHYISNHIDPDCREVFDGQYPFVFFVPPFGFVGLHYHSLELRQQLKRPEV